VNNRGLPEPAIPPRARLTDNRLERAIRRTAVTWEPIPFGTVTNGQRAVVDGTYSFGVYATGGVVIPGTSTATALAMQPWTDGAGTVYLFQFDAATHKMLVTDWTGNEIGNGVNLAAVTNHPFRATLSATLVPSSQTRLAGAGRVLAVEFELGAAWTADSANYWTITAYLRSVNDIRPESVGKTLGAAVSTRERSLAALTAVELYSNGQGPGAAFADSDRIIISAAAQGSPLPFYGASAWAKVSRSVV
jgi:hypothetical protein